MELFAFMVGFPIVCVVLRFIIIGKIERRKEDRLAKKIAEEMKKNT